MKSLNAVWGALGLLAASQAWAVGYSVDVAVYDRSTGRTLPLYASQGQWYVAGRVGAEYELRIRNNTNEDLLTVVSVDGVNVVSGDTASPDQGGYVVAAGQSVNISGWRKNLAGVAAFYFTDHSDAYATRTGRPDDLGVIGVAVFKRKPAPPPIWRRAPPISLREAAPQQFGLPESKAERDEAPASAPRADAKGAPDSDARSSFAPMEKSIGTGHGRLQTSHARYVKFERASDAPNEIVAVRYDTQAKLIAQGVIPQQMREPREPNPFPAHFVADPDAR